MRKREEMKLPNLCSSRFNVRISRWVLKPKGISKIFFFPIFLLFFLLFFSFSNALMVFVDNNRSIFFTSYILEGTIKKFQGSKATLFVKLDKDLLEMRSTKVFSVFCYIKLLSWNLLLIWFWPPHETVKTKYWLYPNCIHEMDELSLYAWTSNLSSANQPIKTA